MTDARLSSATKALLEAARADGPTSAVRAKVWTGVSSAVGGLGAAGGSAAAAGAAGGAGVSAAATGGATAVKMLLVGTLLGGTATVGLATALVTLSPSRALVRPVAAAAAVPPVQVTRRMTQPRAVSAPALEAAAAITLPSSNGITAGSADTFDTAAAEPAPVAPPRPVTLHSAAAAHRSPAVAPTATAPAPLAAEAPSVDPLAREENLVADARAALLRGDPDSALKSIRAARSVPSPQLVPEEMAVEAQALRALGENDQAKGVSASLKSQFPDTALAR